MSDLCRLARFGANISDAHSCFIFLPGEVLASLNLSAPLHPGIAPQSSAQRVLLLAGHHSLSSEVIKECSLATNCGLIGWVATHNRSIHVSPFELDSRTLGIYSSDQLLKSFIGIPIELDSRRSTVGGQCVGVLACDSKKSFAFSKLQGKLLEDLAREISNTLELLTRTQSAEQPDLAWQTFLRRGGELVEALGAPSVDLLRLRLMNYDELEARLGTSVVLDLLEQTLRLINQALPPHFPVVRIWNGDILTCVDSMMASFYENKIRAICEHIAPSGKRPEFDFSKAHFRDRKRKIANIEDLVSSTCRDTAQHPLLTLDRELKYGNGRA